MAIDNSSYNAIMREYENIRANNRAAQVRRIEEVYEKIPQMQDLNNSTGSMAVLRYKESLKSGNISMSNLKKDIEGIKNDKERLLLEAGFPKDYMEMRYDCVDCKDTGYIEGGKCHCLQSKIRKLLYSQSNLENILDKENFENFSFDYYDDKTILSGQNMTNAAYMDGVKKFCEKYIDKYFNADKSKNATDSVEGNYRRSIVFSGNTGVGKTYLSNCIAKVLLDRYYSVIYLSAKELFETMVKVNIEKNEEQRYSLLAKEVYDCDMLIIDDLGSELFNHFTTSEFFHIINRRINTEKSTIISTNLSLDKMRDTYSERVTSRIRKSFIYIRLFGNDIRARL
ncbi:ATP-binding protein [Lachnoanaerobaculum umeaense]|uniref:DNA replication protein DnaC n=1 Tax=Lachnoanaerobaculum umeaense TaxID=617123 RepID=A0A385PXW9_9FIRM|nr:ATP-binding protein [Lachnoanaerobaculum umeaense]AYA99001.1 DNA replication protein DnaC [Lachnoanaerobaculum umeaense]PZW95174.1 DNA replication protein DnaC [Lachnoanaerobaculum umeaense]